VGVLAAKESALEFNRWEILLLQTVESSPSLGRTSQQTSAIAPPYHASMKTGSPTVANRYTQLLSETAQPTEQNFPKLQRVSACLTTGAMFWHR